MAHRLRLVPARAAIAWACLAALAVAAEKIEITSPADEFGFRIGDDYCLANYRQLVTYWRKLERESPRMRVEAIGRSEEGREILMAILSSPRNLKRLDHYRDISRRLALAEGMTDDEARRLAVEGKAVVWIDGGLHGTEVLGSQQLIETVYQMVSRDDDEMRRFLNDVIVLCCCPNPDGLDLVADWYLREAKPSKRSLSGLPRLYQKYIGHDNNRDFLMVTQKETEAVCRVFFQQWFPQIVYNHHQSGPPGTVMFAPPFRDPFNYNFDPLVPLGIDLVGAAMHNRFGAEGKPGVTMRRGANYSTWWNGGLRTVCYFHNMIGLLTETIGNPTPMRIPLQIDRQLASADLPFPIAPQAWHFRQSMDYELTANWAVLDVASRHREQFLWNAYRMGRNSIERGSRDHWTVRPRRIEAARRALQQKTSDPDASAEQAKPKAASSAAPAAQRKSSTSTDASSDVLRDPSERDPRGYILPADQPDFLTATKFVNALIKTGVTVERAETAFDVAGKTYPPGSYVVRTAQAFRPHILDVFEPQDHPNDIPYPGGPPTPPYDNAGWTLAYQMGVQFDRVLDGFSGPFARIAGLVRPPANVMPPAESAAGFLCECVTNDSFLAVNRLLGQRFRVQRLRQPLATEAKTYAAGTWYIPCTAETTACVRQLADQVGLAFFPIDQPPAARRADLRRPRIGLWDRYGGSIDSGWMRWLLEQFEFDFQVVYPPELDRGGLRERYDVLIFVSGAIPNSLPSGRKATDEKTIPDEYRGRSGSITADKTLPQLEAFLEAGGTILTIGASTSLARHLEIPVRSALVEMGSEGEPKSLGAEKFYVPGSVLRARLDTGNPLAAGLPEQIDVFFRQSPAFQFGPEALLRGARPVAWFNTAAPLRSGWAWGQQYLNDAIAIVQCPVDNGSLVLYGPEIVARAQSHGTFKLLFNGIYSAAEVADNAESADAAGSAATTGSGDSPSPPTSP